LETLSLDETKLLYECKILWYIIMKGIEILVFKGFDKVYNYVKYMIGEWFGIIVTYKKMKSYLCKEEHKFP
jgi:hypothetical protein